MVHDALIEELDFVLTHPQCSTKRLESFYHSCLFSYEHVPLFVIVHHIQDKRPDLLKLWCLENDIIHKVTEDLDFNIHSTTLDTESSIQVETNLLHEKPLKHGMYQVEWTTPLDNAYIDQCFKNRKITVRCLSKGEVDLIGLVKIEDFKYGLYVKLKGEESVE